MKKIFFSRPQIREEEKKAVLKTLSSQWLTEGKKVFLFEEKLKQYLGCKFVKILDSCTSALELSLLSLDINKGQEIITTPFTFCATVNAIIHSGATPVFADIDKDTFNISHLEIEKKINKNTKAILVMHYGGLPCDMDKILEIAKKYKIKVIEDSAHALGSKYKGKMVGNISDVACFSFHATKVITTGEGGAIATNSKGIYEFVNKAYFHGIDTQAWERKKSKKFWYYRVVYPGYKYNMSDILASIGIVQLKRLESFIKERERIVRIYDLFFSQSEFFNLQLIPYECRHSRYLYPVLINVDKLKISRDEFMLKLRERNIYTSLHFIPIYRHPFYRKFFDNPQKEFKNTEYVYKRIVSLPLYPQLSNKDVEYIISVIDNVVKKNRR